MNMGLFLLQSAKVSDPVRLFSLLSLGEIGRHMYVQNVVLIFLAATSCPVFNHHSNFSFVTENLLKTSCSICSVNFFSPSSRPKCCSFLISLSSDIADSVIACVVFQL